MGTAPDKSSTISSELFLKTAVQICHEACQIVVGVQPPTDMMTSPSHRGMKRKLAPGADRFGVTNKAEAAGYDSAFGSQVPGWDPQTIADRRAQIHIVGRLQNSFPGLNIVGEEDEEAINEQIAEDNEKGIQHVFGNFPNKFAPELSDANEDMDLKDLIVYVDPVDGTREFAEGRLQFCTVLIGLVYKGAPYLGVIGEPYHEAYRAESRGDPEILRWVPVPMNKRPDDISRILYGGIGVGSQIFEYANEQHQLFTPPPASKCRKIALVSWSQLKPRIEDIADVCKIDPQCTQAGFQSTASAGGAGFKGLSCLRGNAMFWLGTSRGVNRWDLCAPQALLDAAGGCLITGKGEKFPFTGPNVPMEGPTARALVASRDATAVAPVLRIISAIDCSYGPDGRTLLGKPDRLCKLMNIELKEELRQAIVNFDEKSIINTEPHSTVLRLTTNLGSNLPMSYYLKRVEPRMLRKRPLKKWLRDMIGYKAEFE